MSGISICIQPVDYMTPALQSMISFASILQYTFSSVSAAASMAFGTASITAAQIEINSASLSLRQYEEQLERVNSMPIQAPEDIWDMEAAGDSGPPPETTALTVTGGGGLPAELQAANQAGRQLAEIQRTISAQAGQMQVIPPDMIGSVGMAEVKVSALAVKVQQLEGTSIRLGADGANTQLEDMNGQLNQAVVSQSRLNASMFQMDVRAVSVGYRQLNASIQATGSGIQNNVSGQEEFNRAANSGAEKAGKLAGAIKGYAKDLLKTENIMKALSFSDEVALANQKLGQMDSSGNMQPTEGMQQMIFQSAQQTRGTYIDTANAVANFGNLAGDAFDSTTEIVDFSSQVNKHFALAGASSQEIQSSSAQLAQALADGSMSGDELNSVFGQTPSAIQSIAEYMQVPVDQVGELATQGAVSAEVVKNAMLASSEKTNESFANMPMTFGQIFTSFKDQSAMAFLPMLQKLNEIANSPSFQIIMADIVNGLQMAGACAAEVFDVLLQGASWVCDNWSLLAPMIGIIIAAMGIWQVMTIAATIANNGLNLALLHNPLTWIALLIATVIMAIVSWINQVGGLQIAWLICVNAVMTGAAVLQQGLSYAWMQVQNGIDSLVFGMAAAKNLILNTLSLLKIGGLMILESFINGAIDRINQLINFANNISGASIKAINHVEFAAEAAAEESVKIQDRNTELAALYDEQSAEKKARQQEYKWNQLRNDAARDQREYEVRMLRDEQEKRRAAQSAEKSAYLSNPGAGYTPYSGTEYTPNAASLDNISGNTGDTARNTAAMANSVDILDEDLKYLRDAAEQEIINRFTLADLKIDVNNNNTLTSKTDIDDLGRVFSEMTYEIMNTAAEGAF